MWKRFVQGRWALVLLFLFAFVIRVAGVWPNFPYHPDEEGITAPAIQSMYGLLTTGNPDPQRYYYGTLYPTVILGPLYLASSVVTYHLDASPGSAREPFVEYLKNYGHGTSHEVLVKIIARTVASLTGALTVFVVYAIAVELTSSKLAGLLAGSILAISPLHVRESQFGTIDILLAGTLLWSLYLALRTLRTKKHQDLYATAIIGGIAASIKYSFLNGVAPFLALAFLSPDARARFWNIRTVLITILLWIGAYGVANPYPFYAWERVKSYFDNVAYNYHFAIYPDQSLLEAIGGYFLHPSFTGILFTIWLGFTVGFTLLALVGIAVGWKRWFWSTLLLLIPTVPLVGIVLFIRPDFERLNVHYVPILAVFAGLGLWYMIGLIQRQTRSPLVSISLITLVIVGATAYPLQTSLATTLSCRLPSPYTTLGSLLEATIPKEETVFATGEIRWPPAFSQVQSLTRHTVFSLEEVRAAGGRWAVISQSAVDAEYPERKAFVLSGVGSRKYLDNAFVTLALREYEERSSSRQGIEKFGLCTDDSQLIYAMPKLEETDGSTEPIFAALDGLRLRHVPEESTYSASDSTLAIKDLSPVIPLDSGERYQLTFDARTIDQGGIAYGGNERDPFVYYLPERSDPDGFIRIELLDAHQRVRQIVLSPRVTPHYPWSTYTVSFTIPHDVTLARLRFQSEVAHREVELKNLKIFAQ